MSEKTIAWEDYHPEPVHEISIKETSILCPRCGKKLWKRIDLILTSNPPQYQYQCNHCGWVGYNY